MQCHFLSTKNYYLKLRIKILFLFNFFFFNLDYGLRVSWTGKGRGHELGSAWEEIGIIGRFYTRGRIIRLDELGKTLVVRLVMGLKNKDGHKTHELSFEICLELRTTKGSSSGRIMRLVLIFILETHNQTNSKMFAQVSPDG